MKNGLRNAATLDLPLMSVVVAELYGSASICWYENLAK